MSASTSASVRKIVRLDEETINRIAAGEIVQRPAAVIKELIENSLDAGSTSITVTCKGGGLDFLQIQDNGHGIAKESLGIVCERFTTSKISNFEDLNTVATFGFRGEALASITHVAHVTITTMTPGSKCAFKAKYLDGKLVPGRPGDKPDPKPCAGVVGTIIVVEDLFYNMATRRQAFKNPQEEFQRILDVMTKHSIHYPHVSFICKKSDKGGGVASLQSIQNSTTLENIRMIYGPAVARELLEFKSSLSSEDSTGETSTGDEAPTEVASFTVSGYISNANYSCKKSTFVVFINNRLVTSVAIQRCIEAVYKQYLPKHTHPFIYLAVTMPPQHVDVNVHPTKKEVHFLFESELLGLLHESMTTKLEGANDSRVFFTQSLLTAPSSVFTPAPNSDKKDVDMEILDSSPAIKSSTLASMDKKTDYESKKLEASVSRRDGSSVNNKSTKRPANNSSGVRAANKFVRTDPSLQSIDRFFPKASNKRPQSEDLSRDREPPAYCMMCSDVKSGVTSNSSSSTSTTDSTGFIACACCPLPATVLKTTDGSNNGLDLNVDVDVNITSNGDNRLPPYQLTPYDYASLRSLLRQIDDQNDPSLQGLLRRHTMVGLVDDVYLLVQSGTQLVLIDHSILTYHLFRQLSLRRFGIMPPISFSQPVDVKKFIIHALETEEGQWDDATQGGAEERSAVATALCALLASKGDMLREYFQIGFTTDLNTLYLITMPELLTSYRPTPEALPLFLLRLSAEVDWEDEYGCFDSVSKELALCYCALPYPDTPENSCGQDDTTKSTVIEDLPLLSESILVESEIEILAKSDGENDARLEDQGNREGVVHGKAHEQVKDKLSPAARSLLLNTLIPALKTYVCPPKELATEGSFVVIAALEQLYKVFERC